MFCTFLVCGDVRNMDVYTSIYIGSNFSKVVTVHPETERLGSFQQLSAIMSSMATIP